TEVGGLVSARFRHRELDASFVRKAERLVLATGYAYPAPKLLEPLRARIAWDELGNPCVARNYAVACDTGGLFLQNAAPESHGFTSSDLSLGPYRNSIILNTIVGREHFAVERRTAFQEFGVTASDVDHDRDARRSRERIFERADLP